MKDIHIEFAKKCFNETWDLIEKKDRTFEQNTEMLAKAYASYYHWSNCGDHINLLRGAWQLSRVHSLVKEGSLALKYGQYSLKLCLENNVKDFDLAFAYESIARAYFILDNEKLYEDYRDVALSVCESIEKDGDKKYTLSEINSIKNSI
ncbi:MAG: hypothetical protein ACK5LY_07640 [Lachnospirales bacterium]